MSYLRRWRRCIQLLLPVLGLLTFAVGPARAAYQATIDSNVTAFRPPCVGFSDSLPSKMLAAAKAAYTTLGYSAEAYSGATFTKSQTLSRASADWGFYVHSHGDFYYNPADGKRYSGFREDGGSCSQSVVYSKDIAARRAGRQSNLVVISSCHNGEPNTTLPAAFAIEKVKATGSAWNGPEFFLGYAGVAYDNDEWVFEQRFWDALTTGHRVGEAFDIANLGFFSHADFGADWWGSYNGYGLPGPYNPCFACG